MLFLIKYVLKFCVLILWIMGVVFLNLFGIVVNFIVFVLICKVVLFFVLFVDKLMLFLLWMNVDYKNYVE